MCIHSLSRGLKETRARASIISPGPEIRNRDDLYTQLHSLTYIDSRRYKTSLIRYRQLLARVEPRSDHRVFHRARQNTQRGRADIYCVDIARTENIQSRYLSRRNKDGITHIYLVVFAWSRARVPQFA